MSLLEDILISDNPSIWHDFGGTSPGYAGITWQMMIWSIITGLLVFIWMAYNLIMFKHKEGDPEHKDALRAGVFPLCNRIEQFSPYEIPLSAEQKESKFLKHICQKKVNCSSHSD